MSPLTSFPLQWRINVHFKKFLKIPQLTHPLRKFLTCGENIPLSLFPSFSQVFGTVTIRNCKMVYSPVAFDLIPVFAAIEGRRESDTFSNRQHRHSRSSNHPSFALVVHRIVWWQWNCSRRFATCSCTVSALFQLFPFFPLFM